jgi:hypothetical protein
MTKRVTATAAQIRRMVTAARNAGLRIAGIKPDGTIVVYEGGDNPLAPVDPNATTIDNADALRWGDGYAD